MFSFISTQRVKKCFFMSFVFVLLAFFLIGCDSNGDNATSGGSVPDGLVGKWASFDTYEISKTTINYFMPGSEWEGVVYPDTEFKGAIRSVSNFNNTSGVIIWQYIEGAPDPSKPFTATYYRNLTAISVQLANVITLGTWESADTATLVRFGQTAGRIVHRPCLC